MGGFLDTPLYYNFFNVVWSLWAQAPGILIKIAYAVYASDRAVISGRELTFHLKEFDGPLELCWLWLNINGRIPILQLLIDSTPPWNRPTQPKTASAFI